jgi:hypothetical protein
MGDAMLVPEFLLGDYRAVRPKARKFVKDVLAGRAPGELPMVSTEATTALLIVSSDSIHRALVQFQMSAPMATAVEASLADEAKLHLFDDLVASPWGTLGLLDHNSTGLVQLDESRRRLLVKSVLKYWNVYAREGQRFGASMYGPSTLWQIPTMIQVTLCGLGLPADDARSPLPNNDLSALLSRYPAKFAKIIDEAGAESADAKG